MSANMSIYAWTGPEHHHVFIIPAYNMHDMVCKEVSNAIKCGTMIGILINNIIWIDEHGPHLELFNGPTYKWVLHTHWLTLLTITRRMKKMHQDMGSFY